MASAANVRSRSSEDDTADYRASFDRAAVLPDAAGLAVDDGFGASSVGGLDVYAYTSDQQVDQAVQLARDEHLAIAGQGGIAPLRRFGTVLVASSVDEAPSEALSVAFDQCAAQELPEEMTAVPVHDAAQLTTYTEELDTRRRDAAATAVTGADSSNDEAIVGAAGQCMTGLTPPDSGPLGFVGSGRGTEAIGDDARAAQLSPAAAGDAWVGLVRPGADPSLFIDFVVYADETAAEAGASAYRAADATEGTEGGVRTVRSKLGTISVVRAGRGLAAWAGDRKPAGVRGKISACLRKGLAAEPAPPEVTQEQIDTIDWRTLSGN